MGRKTTYKEEYAEQAYKISRIHGATLKDLAEFFGVTQRTVSSWKVKHEDFKIQVEKGAYEFDTEKVEKSLLKRALGMTVTDVEETSKGGVKFKKKVVKELAPDTTACIFWLKNRKPEMWRDRQDVAVDEESLPLTINFEVGKPKGEIQVTSGEN